MLTKKAYRIAKVKRRSKRVHRGAKAQVQGNCKLVNMPLAFGHTLWDTHRPILSSKAQPVSASVRPQT